MEAVTQTKIKSSSKGSMSMRVIKIEKVVLNICAGAEQEHVRRAVTLLSSISNMSAVETKAKKRIASWKIRPGLPIGSKITLRGASAEELLRRLLVAVDSILPKKVFTKNGFSFGIKEYIDIPKVKYDPKVGIIGLDVCVSLSRPGYRVKTRKLRSSRLSVSHSISKEDAMEFVKDKLGVKVE